MTPRFSCCLSGVLCPVAVPDANSYINGWLIRVTEEELGRLDEYEGENYVRIRVTLATGIEAWVYRASPLLLGGKDAP
jgi:gamma-glutamylcyclotransferase (GGCT)/AIG2-like uncharacterized protein YtfP